MAQKFEVATQTMHYYKGEIPLKTKNTPTKTPSKKNKQQNYTWEKSVTQNEGKIGELGTPTSPQLTHPSHPSHPDRHLASFILGRHDIGSLNTNIGKPVENSWWKKGVTFQKYDGFTPQVKQGFLCNS